MWVCGCVCCGWCDMMWYLCVYKCTHICLLLTAAAYGCSSLPMMTIISSCSHLGSISYGPVGGKGALSVNCRHMGRWYRGSNQKVLLDKVTDDDDHILLFPSCFHLSWARRWERSPICELKTHGQMVQGRNQ